MRGYDPRPPSFEDRAQPAVSARVRRVQRGQVALLFSHDVTIIGVTVVLVRTALGDWIHRLSTNGGHVCVLAVSSPSASCKM